MQRGDRLTIGAELIDARDNKQLWGEQYDRKVADLITLQREIARDVSQKLQVRLSGADEQKLSKNYTANVEAYQLYLKGRYHLLKLTPAEIQTGISYFQQAIEVDPKYALAYTGLADANRSLALAGEMPPREFMPKAKAAAEKALEIDDTLADAHANLGHIIFWYDWDWNAAENQYKRALELNPNSADDHWVYAHLLSNTGRQAEARGMLEALLKSTTQRFVSPYQIALIYDGLDERDQTFAWLERGLEQRDPKMAFLKVEPKWNNLRNDPRFANLMLRVGFKP